MNHIQETIETLRAARRRCDDTIVFLEQFQSGVDGVTHPPTEAGDALIEESRRVPGFKVGDPSPLTPAGMAMLNKLNHAEKEHAPRGTAKQGKHPHNPRGELSPASERMMKAVQDLAEPFDAAALASASKSSMKVAAMFLHNRTSRGFFIKAPERGKFYRGKQFARLVGNVTAPVAPASAPTGTVTILDKPDTVVGAMKFLLRDEPEPFTREDLEDTLNGNKDWKKLLETDAGKTAMSNALFQWSANGRLTKKEAPGGFIYQVTPAGKEWFNQ